MSEEREKKIAYIKQEMALFEEINAKNNEAIEDLYNFLMKQEDKDWLIISEDRVKDFELYDMDWNKNTKETIYNYYFKESISYTYKFIIHTYSNKISVNGLKYNISIVGYPEMKKGNIYSYNKKYTGNTVFNINGIGYDNRKTKNKKKYETIYNNIIEYIKTEKYHNNAKNKYEIAKSLSKDKLIEMIGDDISYKDIAFSTGYNQYRINKTYDIINIILMNDIKISYEIGYSQTQDCILTLHKVENLGYMNQSELIKILSGLI